MNCMKCGTLLTCHEKTYPETETFKAKTVMQWQNEDGSAHYSTSDGKNFSCNIPNDKSDNKPSTDTNTKLYSESVEQRLDSLTGICQSILEIVSGIKMQLNKEDSS